MADKDQDGIGKRKDKGKQIVDDDAADIEELQRMIWTMVFENTNDEGDEAGKEQEIVRRDESSDRSEVGESSGQRSQEKELKDAPNKEIVDPAELKKRREMKAMVACLGIDVTRLIAEFTVVVFQYGDEQMMRAFGLERRIERRSKENHVVCGTIFDLVSKAKQIAVWDSRKTMKDAEVNEKDWDNITIYDLTDTFFKAISCLEFIISTLVGTKSGLPKEKWNAVEKRYQDCENHVEAATPMINELKEQTGSDKVESWYAKACKQILKELDEEFGFKEGEFTILKAYERIVNKSKQQPRSDKNEAPLTKLYKDIIQKWFFFWGSRERK